MTSLQEDDLSLAQKIAMLPPEMREAAMEGLPPEQILTDWSFRPVILA
jgi:hypothetical protein